MEEVKQTKPNRLRRACFVFGGALLFSSMAFYSLLFTEGSATEIFIKGCLGIVEIIVIMYLGTTTVDRSEILSKIGDSMRVKANNSDSNRNNTPNGNS